MTDATTASDTNIVDVRSLVPAQRHAKIFQLGDELALALRSSSSTITTRSRSTISSRPNIRSSSPGSISNADQRHGGSRSISSLRPLEFGRAGSRRFRVPARACGRRLS